MGGSRWFVFDLFYGRKIGDGFREIGGHVGFAKGKEKVMYRVTDAWDELFSVCLC